MKNNASLARTVPNKNIKIDNKGELNVSMAALTFPAFLTIAMSVAYGIIDSWFLSKISDSAAASVGGVFSFLAMCAFMLRSFAQAGGIIAGQYLGAEQDDQVSRAFSTSMVINACMGLILASVIYFLHGQIGVWLGFDTALQAYAEPYLEVAGLIVFLQAFTLCYLVFMAMHGKTLWNMSVIALLNIVNIGGNYLLLAYDNGRFYSVVSIVWMSVFAQFICLLVSAYLVHRHLKIHFALSLVRGAFRRIARPILKIAIPSSLFPVSLQLNLLALVAVISTLGADILATQVYSVNIIMLVVAWTSAVSQSAQIYIARLAGAQQYIAAHKCYLRCLRWAIIGVLISVAAFCLLGREIFGLLTDNPEIIHLGVIILIMGFLLEPFRAINLVSLASLNAVGDAKIPGLLSITMMWVIGFTLSWVFAIPLGYGLVGVYIGRIIDEVLRAIMVFFRWSSGVWQGSHG